MEHKLISNWKVEIIAGVEWRVSPGVAWCAAGCRIQIHAAADLTRIGAWASIGDQASIGAWASIGDRARIGAGASIGDRARIGAKAKFLFDLGSFEGYRKVICDLEGVAYIGAGCRWFCLSDAKKNWNATRKDRPITHAMLAVAIKIAKINKLKLK